MPNSAKRRLLPWGSVLTVFALAMVLLRVFPNDPETDLLLPPVNLAAAFVAVIAVFLIERRLNRYLWGVAAAVLLIWHPSFQRPFVQGANPALLAESLVAATLACTLLAWDLTFLPAFAWWSWVVANVALGLCISIAWVEHPPAGLRAATLATIGTGTAFVLSRWGRPRQPGISPSRWNSAAAGVTAVLAPSGGFLLVPRVGRALGWLQGSTPVTRANLSALLSSAVQTTPGASWRELTPSQIDVWCWPSAWLVLPVLSWTLWRTLRRGWKQRRLGEAPLSWLLSLTVLLTVLGLGVLPPVDPGPAVLWLTVLVVLLGVFWIADLVRGGMERLVLKPPPSDA